MAGEMGLTASRVSIATHSMGYSSQSVAAAANSRCPDWCSRPGGIATLLACGQPA